MTCPQGDIAKPTRAGTRARLLTAGGVALSLAHAWTGGVAGLALTATFATGAAAVLWAALGRRPDQSPGAPALAGGVAAFGLGTAASRLATLALPAAAAVTLPLHSVGYLLFLLAVMQRTRARLGARVLAEMLDISVFSAAACLVVWRLVWVPLQPTDTGGVYFFLLCGMVLDAAVSARLVVLILRTTRTGPRPLRALPSLLSMVGFFPVTAAGIATVCGVIDGLDGFWHPGPTYAAAWPLTATLLLVAATLPGANDTATPDVQVDAPLDRWRLYLIGTATPVPLVLGLVTDLSGQPGRVVLCVGIVMSSMATVRTGLAFRRTRDELDRRTAAEAELRQQARFDTLSGLPNRALFTTRLDDAVTRAAAEGSVLAVLYLDLDRFKVINDSFGQPAGDQVLVTVGDRLRAAVRDGDTPARLSGDEFAVILEGVDGTRDAVAIAERIRESMREPIAVAGTSVVVGASVGLSVYDDHARPAELLREADVALTDAKQQGRNAVAVFDASLRGQLAQALAFEHDLVRAVDHAELRLHFQPQVDLATGAICGLEALLRWQHPTQGLLNPAAFVDIAETTGMIVPIGVWVLDEACRQHRRWQATLGPHLVPPIAVNVSPTQLVRDDVAGRVRRALAASRLDPVQLHIEITEVALMGDPERAGGALDAVDRQGVAIAVDDFGTGYFSLSHLRRFPVHRIKIDRSFVRGIGSSSEDEAIIDATIDLAHALGLSVVAEGVETAQQLAYVRRKGCDVVQGYVYARPLPPGELAAFLRDWAARQGVAAQPAPDRRPELAPITGPLARTLATEGEPVPSNPAGGPDQPPSSSKSRRQL